MSRHLEIWQLETFASPREQDWLKWVAVVESLLGHSLDGNQMSDGYSLDYAADAFADGVSPQEYVEEICECANYLRPSRGLDQ